MEFLFNKNCVICFNYFLRCYCLLFFFCKMMVIIMLTSLCTLYTTTCALETNIWSMEFAFSLDEIIRLVNFVQ